MTVLTAKQRRFVDEYLIDLNAAQAAVRAGYSPKTAEQAGYQLLQKTSVATAVQRAVAERSERTRITADRVLAELAHVAFSDMRRFAAWGAGGVKLNESVALDDDVARCVSEVAQTVTAHGGSIRFKLHDKVAALKLVAEHLGMFGEKGKDGEDFGMLSRMSDEELEAYRRKLRLVD
jgi:phage terminase small subunit